MFFKYEVNYFDDIEGKQKIVNGLVFGQSYAAAIKELTDYYGEEMIASISLKSTEADCPVYEMSEKEA